MVENPRYMLGQGKTIVLALGGNALGNTPQEQLSLVKNTARSIVDAGLRLDLQAPTPQYPSITSALDAYLQEQNHAKS